MTFMMRIIKILKPKTTEDNKKKKNISKIDLKKRHHII
jgi:hypothetical protein